MSSPSLEELLGYIENPKIFQVNKLPARSYYIPANAQCLNGSWDFLFHDSLLSAFEAVDLEFQSLYGQGLVEKEDSSGGGGGGDVGHWSPINVPGHWQLQGFGKPQYTNIMYPIPMNPPYVPSDNPTGVYQTRFQIDSLDKNYRLRFDGVDSGYFVFLNGKFVGYAQGSRNSSEFDIGKLVKEKHENHLVVVVVQWCDGSFIEDQDQWWLSGIFRDVNLIGYDPKGHIEDFRFDTTEIVKEEVVEEGVLKHKQHAKIAISTSIFAVNEASVEVKVTDSHGNHVIEDLTYVNGGGGLESTPPVTTKSLVFNLDIPNPILWSAEAPYLYHVDIILSSTNSAVLQRVTTHLGIRTIEIKDGQFLVNNNPILLRGINRHDDNSQKGRAISEEDVKHDLLLMKKYNINTIRCSHYPSHPSLVHWADMYGFYIIDEADLECHGFGYTDALRDIDYHNVKQDRQLPRTDPSFSRKHEDFTSDNPLWKEAYLDRAQQLAHRDKNHPSVIMWSLGNEAFFGENHVAMYKWLKNNFNHPVHYEQDNGNNEAHYVDVYSRMYSPHWYVEEEPQRDGKPFMLCEYGHAMGNGPGGLKEYQDLFYKYPRLLGGCIWEWANHGLRKPIEGGKRGQFYYAYGGDFDEPIHDSTFVMDGMCDSEHLPTPSLYQYKHVIQPVLFIFSEKSSKDVVISIKNLHDHISLNDEQFYIKVIAELIPTEPSLHGKKGTIIFDEKLDFGKDIAPYKTGKYEVTIDTKANDEAKYNEVIVTASIHLSQSTPWAEADHEIGFGQYKIVGSGLSKPIVESEKGLKFSVSETISSFNLSSGIANISVSKATGKFNIIVNGKQQIKEGPNIGFWRAPTDNDRGESTWYWEQYHVNHIHQSIESVKVEQTDGGDAKVAVHTWIAPAVVNWGIDTTLTYHFTHNTNNSIEINTIVDLTPKGPYVETLPRIGLDFVLDDSLSNVRWAGFDVESYSDSNFGKIGVHEAANEDLFYNYEVPQENGNRAQTRWVQVYHDSSASTHKFHAPLRQLVSLSNKLSPSTSSESSIAAIAQSSNPSDLINFSIQPYNPFQLEKAAHPYQLDPKQRRNNFRVDFAIHGLGSASCGPGVLDQYKLKLAKSTYNVRFIIN